MTMENQNDSWSTCQPGTLNGLASQFRREANRRQLSKAVLAASSAIAGCAVVVMLLLNRASESDANRRAEDFPPSRLNYATAMSCGDVLDLRDQYLLGELAVESRQQIRSHLGHCERCAVAYRARAQELQVEYSVLVLPPVDPSFALYAAR